MHLWKKAIPLIVITSVSLIFIFLPLFLFSIGFLKGNIQGFALDADEKLYIGTKSIIQVYANGEKIKEFAPYPSIEEDYRFAIQNDTIIIGRKKWKNAKTYDLTGNYRSDSDLSYEDVRKIAESRITVEQNGNVYSYEDHRGFAPAEILRNGEPVYQMSICDALFSGWSAIFIRVVLFAFLSVAIISFVTDEEVKAYLETMKRI